ncbi:MAG: hypothetical protein G3M70_08820 [Candidatus Nitronauta litoralis]|uniref:Uncharacterized protein n=1 Tax=Candidatus Nitronauta litoralis TaxID=2705533 RepID=A0A7T0FZW3_9BACT|nr:MAG: hypothetical protein G3M70_08820 [Candidatus Nitronauta litoralis]
MKKLFRLSTILLFSFLLALPAQAQTLEERVTALEGQMANVELLSTQLFQLFSALQPDITAILNALSAQALDVATLQADMGELQSRLNGVSRTGDTLLLTDMNLQVVSGSGATDAPVNGKGNVIIGYNEDIFAYEGGGLPASDKTGSHNLIVGKGLNYTSFGSIAAGLNNIAGADYTAATGGNRNKATANFATVTGGVLNTASGDSSSVSGGLGNTASGSSSSITGGENNTATDLISSVNGGENNVASGPRSNVSGGQNNTASGIMSSVSGGQGNEASGLQSSISGGRNNIASANRSSVSGGDLNRASGGSATVSGGQSNEASGSFSTVGGGVSRDATGHNDWAAGSLFEDF